MTCKEMGPYAIDLPFEFGNFLLLAMFVGIVVGLVGAVLLLGKERQMGERVIHEGGDDAATRLASEIAKEELRKAIEAQEKAEKEKNK